MKQIIVSLWTIPFIISIIVGVLCFVFAPILEDLTGSKAMLFTLTILLKSIVKTIFYYFTVIFLGVAVTILTTSSKDINWNSSIYREAMTLIIHTFGPIVWLMWDRDVLDIFIQKIKDNKTNNIMKKIILKNTNFPDDYWFLINLVLGGFVFFMGLNGRKDGVGLVIRLIIGIFIILMFFWQVYKDLKN